MTIKEAILKSLDELIKPTAYNDVYEHIVKKNYCDFNKSKTPTATISAALGDFIRNGDTRVKRFKEYGAYFYYLSKNEHLIGVDILSGETKVTSSNPPIENKGKSYHERDLHKLLSTYLKSKGIFSKTIFHEQSNGKDDHQTWTHPDMVGVKFSNLQTKVSQSLLQLVNRGNTFKLNSYEIKKEVNNDNELKRAFFQAVSNSTWANYGYLVAFEFSDSLMEEIERLNQSFGIGIIELNSNPYQSKVLYQATHREIDFKTVDKICNMNKAFEKFVEQTEKLMNAEERYYQPTEKELKEFCDDYFGSEAEAEKYCMEKNIPADKD